MRHHISVLMVAAATLLGCAHRPHVAAPSSPDTTGRLTTAFGEFSPAGSAWTVRVSDSDRQMKISRNTQFGSTAVSPSKWKAETGWFAFVENDERVWAYDGHGYLYLLTLTKDGTGSYGPRAFPCPIPHEVYTRLSASAQKDIESHE